MPLCYSWLVVQAASTGNNDRERPREHSLMGTEYGLARSGREWANHVPIDDK